VGHHPAPGERAVAGDDRLGDLGMRRVDVVGREPVAVEDRPLEAIRAASAVTNALTSAASSSPVLAATWKTARLTPYRAISSISLPNRSPGSQR
jgi:hypothetical protein